MYTRAAAAAAAGEPAAAATATQQDPSQRYPCPERTALVTIETPNRLQYHVLSSQILQCQSTGQGRAKAQLA